MKPRYKPWTEQDNERLKQLVADGATAARAAAALNRTIESVKGQAAKLGIKFLTLREQRKKLGKPLTETPWWWPMSRAPKQLEED